MGIPHQRLTIFGDDDLTPLVGSVDVNGAVTDPSISTDPAHPRPYLKFSDDRPDQAIDFKEGSVGIAQASVEVIDYPTVGGDQNSGWWTWLQSAASGDSRALGARVKWEELDEVDGVTWHTILDGQVYKVKLISSGSNRYVTYAITLRDGRERERKARLFTKATDTAIFPFVGPSGGYGRRPRVGPDGKTIEFIDSPVMLPIPGLRCVYKKSALVQTDGSGNPDSLGTFQIDTSDKTVKDAIPTLTEKHKDVWVKWGAIKPAQLTPAKLPDPGLLWPGSSLGFYAGGYFPDVILEWSADPMGAAGWNTFEAPEMRAQPWAPDAFNSEPNLFTFRPTWPGAGGNGTVLSGIRFYATPQQVLDGMAPADGQVVYVRVRSNRAPTEEVPMWVEETFGTLMKKVYDGVYSDFDPHIRYNVPAVTALATTTPMARAKITEPAEDARTWMQGNWYKPLGYAPLPTEDGLITPVKYALPGPTVPLLNLDDSNVIEADWEHGTEEVVNYVTFGYQRDIVPGTLLVRAFADMSKIATQEVSVERLHVESARKFGFKKLEFAPETMRSVIRGSTAMPNDPFSSSELGNQLGLLRSFEAVDRFANGAQTVVADCLLSDAGVKGAKPGDWVVLGVSWLPDYQTGRRGISRLMQITKAQKASGGKRTFTLLDAGPHNQPVTAPTFGALTLNDDRTVTIPITALPDAGSFARVDYAYGVVEPDSDSGQWRPVGRTPDAATVYSQPMLPGEHVWFRGRAEAPGLRPSAWASIGNFAIAPAPSLADAGLFILSDGTPRVALMTRADVGSVRIAYQRHDAATVVEVPGGGSVDVQVTDQVQTIDLPLTLAQLEYLTITITPYIGWTGAAVSGVAGNTSVPITAQRLNEAAVLPVVTESRQIVNNVATLTLDVNDPQKRIVDVAFATRQGDNGVMSGWSVDAVPPYAASVSVPVNQSSAIRYRVRGYNADGDVVVLQETEWTAQDVATAQVVLSHFLVSSTATQEVWQVEGTSPDGAPVTVRVVSVDNTALQGGDQVGTDYPSPHQFTFSRPAALGGDAAAQIAASSAGWADDTDSIIIPAQGRDTVPLQVRLKPTGTTTTTLSSQVNLVDGAGDAAVATLTFVWQGLTTVNIGGVNRASGYQTTLAPGTTLAVIATRPTFGNGIGKIEVLATKAGRVQDSDSMDVAPQDRDTIMPFMRRRVSEAETIGSLQLEPVDPQARLKKVEAQTTVGNGAPSAWSQLTADGSGFYNASVSLVEKQPSVIAWRVTATTVTGVDAIVDEGVERFGLGAVPLKPEMKYQWAADGTLTVTARGDSDTTNMRVLVKFDAAPTKVEVDANGALFSGRVAPYTYGQVPSGSRVFMAARAYNSALGGTVDNQGSLDIEVQNDVWTGLSSSGASVVVGRTTATDQGITLDQITLSAQTARVDVFVREYSADPGPAVSVAQTGYRAPGTPLLPPGGSMAIVVPVAKPSHYVLVTLIPYDNLSRSGPTVNLKAQAAAAPPPGIPNPPSNLTLAASGASGVDLAITAPGSGLPASWRVYRDGVALPDVPVTVGGGAVQHFIDSELAPGSSHTYIVYGVSGTGVVSSTGSPQQTITLGASVIPTPALSAPNDGYDAVAAGVPVTITPGAGTPSGVLWHLEHSPDGVSWASVEQTTQVEFMHSHAQSMSQAQTDRLRVWGSLAGWGDSGYSNTAIVNIPIYGG